MLERVVENWLTSAGEKGYQTPFAQLLSLEGHLILQGPAHHAFEHGKDIVGLSKGGEVDCFQLKGGTGKMTLPAFEHHQNQLQAACLTAIEHPRIGKPRRPDRVFFVSNQVFTPPVRDRIRAITQANIGDGLPPIEPVEREQLAARFSRAHGKFLPHEPEEYARFLRVFLADGEGPFDNATSFEVLEDLLPFGQPKAPKSKCQQAIGSATLLTSYMAGPWLQRQNHLGVAEGWLLLCSQVLSLAIERGLQEKYWRTSFDLAFAEGRRALHALIQEAAAERDLLGPGGMVEPTVYQTRALIVCGFAAGLYLSDRVSGHNNSERDRSVLQLLERELPYARPHGRPPLVEPAGEVWAPYLMLIAWALEALGRASLAEELVSDWVRIVALANKPRSSRQPLPDPYHPPAELLLERWKGADSKLLEEDFGGHAYTLRVGVEWLARRLLRQALALFWPEISRIQHCEHRVSSGPALLRRHDNEGSLEVSAYPIPTSWRDLRNEAAQVDSDAIPPLLFKRSEFFVFLPLIFPYRMNAVVARALEHVITGRVELAEEGPKA